MTNFWEYSFILRGLEAGILVAIIAPLIGIFLVLRRYALLADTLSHVSLSGVAIGILLGIHPLLTAILASVASAVVMERLRETKRVYGDTALSLFLSGSLALAIVLLGLAHGLNANLFQYLFGSIVTVRSGDVWLIASLAVVGLFFLLVFYRELVAITFDEDVAAVNGLPVRFLNNCFIIIAAMVIAIAIPVVGILLISALVVIPVVAALQLKKSFCRTVIWAEVISVAATILGIILSFWLDLPSGGTIVLLMLAIFAGLTFWRRF
ncbi:MAG: metal ABC transporter permease [Candidatus Magasanikbacteria bacterium]|nr:metal ABC transporter permease [Candidatus Magasanikbacteria bacterium]